MKTLLEIAYSGKNYHGWQVQPNQMTVQGCLQEAFERVCRTPCALTGCSRTDSGVHALQFFCTAETDRFLPIPLEKLPIALNTVLPDDLVVCSARVVPENFHPRYAAKEKEYLYHIRTSPIPSPFLNGFVWQYSRKLRVDRMQEAASHLIGRFDFTSFCAAASDVADKVRTVSECSVIEKNDLVTIIVRSDGFLYNMVRIIVGTLVGVSEGRFSPADLLQILEKKDRRYAGMTAPPGGLYLNRVLYTDTDLLLE